MKEEHYIKTYGIEEGFSKGIKGYFVRCDGRRTSLFFKRKDFALMKAEAFIKRLHTDFVWFVGAEIEKRVCNGDCEER
jgi:hypothetical protein